MDTDETWMDVGYIVGVLSGALMLTWFGWGAIVVCIALVAWSAWRRERRT